MNTDIRLSVEFMDHPKTVKLRRRLGADAVLSLISLWLWTAQNRPDGILTEMDVEAIEIASKWSGEDGVLVETLVALKWIDPIEDGYAIHDWSIHNSWACESEGRASEARLNRLAQVNREAYEELKSQGRTGISKEEYLDIRQRKLNASSAHRQRDASVTPAASQPNACALPAPAPAPAPAPSPSPAPSPAPAPWAGDTTLVLGGPNLDAPDGAVSGVETPTGGSLKTFPCPHQEIIEAYHKILPELPRIEVWNDARKAMLRRLWREDRARQSIDWWETFFRSIRGQPFLMGNGDKAWIADLEWLIRPNNFPKVLEGRYRPRDPTPNVLSRAGQQTWANMQSVLRKIGEANEPREDPETAPGPL